MKQRRDIIVAVYDPRKLVKIIDMLNSYKALVKGIDENMKEVRGVIIVDENGLRYINEMNIKIRGMVLNVDLIGIERCAIMSIVFSRTLSSDIKNVIIGVDYGEKVGIAILTNSDVVFINSYRDKAKALKTVKAFIDNVEVEKKIVRIGLPNKPHKGFDEFVNKLTSSLKGNVVIEFVSENGSSRRKLEIDNTKIDEDSLAAINIALQRVYSNEP